MFVDFVNDFQRAESATVGDYINRILSIKLDDRYALKVIDTKAELPENRYYGRAKKFADREQFGNAKFLNECGAYWDLGVKELLKEGWGKVIK